MSGREDGRVWTDAMRNPAIINSWNRAAMRRVRSFPDATRLPILDTITRATQNAIARARADEWLSVEYSIELCDTLVDVLGAERAVEFWRDLVYDSWVGGLLEPLSAGLHSTPDLGDGAETEQLEQRNQGVLALAPAAWSMSTRDCGEIVVAADEDAGSMRLEAHNLPPIVRVSEGIQVLYAGAVKAMLAFSKLSTHVEIDTSGDTLAFSLTFRD
ncbi:hypothetical protein [Enhygromyxa salina]|uniref:Uncharacterized protein n=1 Tax=Enhygromyxa salina TaxID=215803 RepID=A0A2S9YR82_9BACT|nr:hypothetical protein [Enhygromyxa salina]PRQ07605.1 hypothetical protein ENSA7_25950 [Enhygromyxa salina]